MTKKATKKKASKKKASEKRASKKVASTPRGRGRPSKFDQLDLGMVEKLARKGWTDAEMSDFFGVTEQTWNNWKVAHPDFFESIKDWKLEADEKVERSLFERATGYTHPEEKVFNFQGEIVRAETRKHYPPDTAAATYWLNNRRKEDWRSRHEFTQKGDLDNASKDEILAALKQRLTGMKEQGHDLAALVEAVNGGDT